MNPFDYYNLTDEEKLKLAEQQAPSQFGTPSPAPTSFDVTAPSNDELKAKIYESLRSRMGGEGSYADQIKQAQEAAAPSTGAKIAQALATFASVASGKQAPDYMKMNQEIADRAAAPIREKQKMEAANLDDYMKLSGLTRQEASDAFEKRKYDEGAKAREAELAYKKAAIGNLGKESLLKEQELLDKKQGYELKGIDLTNEKNLALVNSPESRAIQDMAIKAGAPESVRLLPASSLLKNQKILDMVQEQKKAQLAQDLKQNPTPQSLSTTDKQRYDNLVLGKNAVEDMKNAWNSGENTFSVIGDNKFTEARRRWEDAIGRLQSGGAINRDEEERFKNMAPAWKDTREMQQNKIDQMEKIMNDRLTTMVGAKNAGGGAGPAVGTIKSGYRFLGGNPNDKNSWEKI